MQKIVEIDVPFLDKEILACGAEVKNTFCLTKKEFAFLSPPLGDLENLEILSGYERKIEELEKELQIKPALIACDLHPEYLSTKYAREIAGNNSEIKLIAVQHHHAHIASCMAERNLEQRVIGVAFDGTGFGEDANVWGGEFLIADYNAYQRAAHLCYIPMPGGNQAILEPWRMAATYLYQTFGEDFLELNLDFLQRLNRDHWQILKKMISQGVNSPLTSSIGRLFDAVSSLLGIRDKIDYQGEAAIELEKQAAKCPRRNLGRYDYEVNKEDGVFIIEVRPLIKGVVADLQAKVSLVEISAKFHTTLAKIVVTVCEKIREEAKLNDVVLSGGVFQNKILTHQATQLLSKEQFSVYTHSRVPAHDGGLSLGQALIASF